MIDLVHGFRWLGAQQTRSVGRTNAAGIRHSSENDVKRGKHLTQAEPASSAEFGSTIADLLDAPLLYASDVRIVVDPGGLELIFTRVVPSLAETENGQNLQGARSPFTHIVARVELPPLAAQRLLSLLPEHLDTQRDLANAYARATNRTADPVRPDNRDHFLDALAAAEDDDEPYTDEQREAVAAGWEAYQRGETAPWDVVRRELLERKPEEEDGSPASMS
jgi:hypothetical protein